MSKKKISVVTACYNEEGNVTELCKRVKEQFDLLPDYDYEHVFIDNASHDSTVSILKGIAANDKNVKIIVNTRNFGHVRSPFYGLLQVDGDAVISIVADLQDPVEMISEFIKKWEEGQKIVVGIKVQSKESCWMFAMRKIYYKMILASSSPDNHISNFTGFGLYDKSFINILRQLDDPYPYFRGLVAELGSDIYKINYVQPLREKGKTKNNFYTLYDMAMLGFVNHSKLPLRIIAYLGFISSLISFIIGIAYFVYKLIMWDSFNVGMAPLIVGLFFFSSVQLLFIGIIGEYIGAIYTQVHKRPLVVEKERVNF